MTTTPFTTRADLRADLTALGLRPGDAVLAPVVDGFATIVTDFVESGRGVRGRAGAAESVLVDAAARCASAAWMDRHDPV